MLSVTPASAPASTDVVVRGSWSFVIINYAETPRLNVILTSAMVLNDPQNPHPCNYWEYFTTEISQRLNVINFLLITVAIKRVRGSVIINYAKTPRFRVILTSAMALNVPQNSPL